MMTPAASVLFVDTELSVFLYASIGEDSNEMQLSVLSALARLNIDPWGEAAELSQLPKDSATQRLASLIARLPGRRWPQADCAAIADRLIELLPHHSGSNLSLAQETDSFFGPTHSAAVKVLIWATLGVTVLFIAASREPSSLGDHVDIPVVSTASPPQNR